MVRSLTDRDERFARGSELFISQPGEGTKQPVKVASGRKSAKGPLIRLEGYTTREQARELNGRMLYITASELAMPEDGSYYGFQLEGCTVYAGERLVGIVVKLAESRANAFLEVEPEGGGDDFAIPFVKEVILSVDLERQRIEIPENFLE